MEVLNRIALSVDIAYVMFAIVALTTAILILAGQIEERNKILKKKNSKQD